MPSIGGLRRSSRARNRIERFIDSVTMSSGGEAPRQACCQFNSYQSGYGCALTSARPWTTRQAQLAGGGLLHRHEQNQ